MHTLSELPMSVESCSCSRVTRATRTLRNPTQFEIFHLSHGSSVYKLTELLVSSRAYPGAPVGYEQKHIAGVSVIVS